MKPNINAVAAGATKLSSPQVLGDDLPMPVPPGVDLLTVGEALSLVTPRKAIRLDMAEDFTIEAAGAELNVASHGAALGARVEWAGRLGRDPLGRRILDELAARNVGRSWVELDAEAPTGLYVKDPGGSMYYYRSGSAASLGDEHFASRISLDRVRIVHVTGITPALSESCSRLVDELIKRVRTSSALLSFDVNYRPTLWRARGIDEIAAAERLRELADAADIVFVGLDEAALWRAASPRDVRERIPHPQFVIVKDGSNAAMEFDGQELTTVPALQAEPVEVVGAGDAFAAGYLVALLLGEKSEGRLLAGHKRALTTMTSTTDFPRIERSRP